MYRLFRQYRSCIAVLVGLGLAASAALPQSKENARPTEAAPPQLFARDNLIAWCIVPFDSKKRTPEQRAEMLKRLGFRHFAYDWRAEHVATFDAEVAALRKNGISLDAFWFPAALDKDARTILDLLKRHKIHAQLWVTMGDPVPAAKSQVEKVQAAVKILRPIVAEAAKIDCSVGLYNHGGWFGEPENQIAVIESLKEPNVGIVYNLHHGHAHIDRLADLLVRMKPHLYAINLNGMDRGGEQNGRKILPLGQGALDLQLLNTIVKSGYSGRIGILGHTMNDAEDQLKDNLDGLDWLVPQLNGALPGRKPVTRTPVPAPPKSATKASTQTDYNPERAKQLLAEAKKDGNASRGADVFRAPQFACLSCHRVGKQGGTVGPDLTLLGRCIPQPEIVEAVLWPKLKVKEGYVAWSISLTNGTSITGYKESENNSDLVLRDPTENKVHRLSKTKIEAQQQIGSLMPDGLTAAMSPQQLRDLIRFLIDLGIAGAEPGETLLAHGIGPASFSFERNPLQPEYWPSWQRPVNRDRVYDFYAKEAEYFWKHPGATILPEFPGLDGGKYGHWGNQSEETWADGRWNKTDLGSLMSGVFHAPGIVVPKGVCIRIGEHGELATCFNPETLCYDAVWQGGFVKFSAVRHGFLDGLIMDGKLVARPKGERPDKPFVYHGFYRHGRRVIFSYRIGDTEFLDSPWVSSAGFERIVGPARDHPLAKFIHGGPAQWPEIFQTKGVLGQTSPYAIDTIKVPFDNPWKAPLFFGDHDFLPDGTAFICTMQGDVWRVQGLDGELKNVQWKRFASGLHHALGLVVANGDVYVLGRDQITRLHDLNGDGEADFYECFSNAYRTSPAGHDFICGLQRDAAGRFYTASGPQGVIRISADGKSVETLATGFRNPDGLGLMPDGSVTVPCSEGEWTPASMVALVKANYALAPGSRPPHFGYGGPVDGKPPQLPLVYFPRGLDNSSGAQVPIPDNRWGPLQGLAVHFSYGAASHFLMLRDEVGGQPQGAVVPMPGEFASGAHRGRFNPHDGQLYVSGMGGWGTYSEDDGCFQRVRYTGAPVNLPVSFHAYENGVSVAFSQPLSPEIAGKAASHLAQCWNYRYGQAYGSAEYSSRHIDVRGHDVLTIASAHLINDGRTLFLEIPDLQPVNQLHLHLRADNGAPRDLFATIHRMDVPFTNFADYKPVVKQIAAHPMLVDLARTTKTRPNPWKRKLPDPRTITIEAGKNLSFTPRELSCRPGEAIKLVFRNPDVVPHNWLLLKPGSLQRVGDLANKLISSPDAVTWQYVPQTDDVLAYADIAQPNDSVTIYFRAPKEKNRYPFVCSFPGHWMVMNGVLKVE
jgi:putative heme-binding domain-containing protein